MNIGVSVAGLDPTFDHLVSLMAPSKVRYSAGQPYTDYSELRKDFDNTGYITVSTDYSTSTIFGDEVTNWKFRAWHDLCHIKANADFTPEGERRAALEMVAQLLRLNGPTMRDKERWVRLIDEEVNGQTSYFIKHNAYPIDQRQFAVDFLTKKYGPNSLSDFPKSADEVTINY